MAPANYARYKKQLGKVTARGEFRWLIDPDTVVFGLVGCAWVVGWWAVGWGRTKESY